MPGRNSRQINARARTLRRKLTHGERKLWQELRQFKRLYGLHVRKQAPIRHCVVDFVIHSAGLIIEVDGEHHQRSDQMEYDRKRDAWLTTQGYRVLRFTTGELAENFDGCIEVILKELDSLR